MGGSSAADALWADRTDAATGRLRQLAGDPALLRSLYVRITNRNPDAAAELYDRACYARIDPECPTQHGAWPLGCGHQRNQRARAYARKDPLCGRSGGQ